MFGHPKDGHRDAMIGDWRQDIKMVKTTLPEIEKLTLAIFLATNWQEFIKEFGAISAFEAQAQEQKLNYVNRCHQKTLFWEAQMGQLSTRQIFGAQQKDAAAQYFAASFVMYFCLAVAMEDVEWECELARELDELLAIGWSISLGATLTPADQVALNRKIEFFAR